ncbi:hypothetical protein GOP47_0022081 [Adiantum capillus-veneris]|uniref:Uncharacterized protein n=1 Tax=Adiantum capillus-veneris TaxID=13818 RepID=A0A9D4Z6S8_ADICA|nr:hypothetical protein GOP47_0022081 [Adiantum capillus-veneris]
MLVESLLFEHLSQHLETEKGNNNEPGHNQSGESSVNDEPHKITAASRRKGSIFSVQEWNEITTKGLDGKDASYGQERSQLPSTFLGDVNTGHSQASAELGTDSCVDGDTTKGLNCLGTAENVVDDMLGLIFGPTLSKTVNTRLESSQIPVQDVNKSTVTYPAADMLDVVLPLSVDSAPQPKKKSSLKDKVMMYLG